MTHVPSQSSYKNAALINAIIRFDRELKKMHATIYLSCLVVIIGNLAWSASAQRGFESDKARVVSVYKNATTNSVGDSNVYFLVTFLAKYADQIQLTPEQRSKANTIVSQYNAERANQPLVDGVPPQGGWLTKLFKAIVIQLGIELASEGIKKATGAKD